jgi:S-adenosyl-L-methionine hydrolase (adenosine-forming)
MAVVTFTTDFGRADCYAGAMKGVVLSLAPDAVLVDITHDVPARDVASGALTLAQAARCFPPGTIHVAVVDPGVGGVRAEVVVAAGGAYFVGPDNGVLALAAAPPRRAWRIENAAFRREPVSPTFHGRDVFAATAGRLAAGWSADRAGSALPDIAAAPVAPAAVLADGSEAKVLHVDGFGNLVTSLTTDAPVTGTWRLEVGGAAAFDLTGGRTFSDVPVGAFLLYDGSGGQVEIAVRDGSAAQITGARPGALLRLRRSQ